MVPSRLGGLLTLLDRSTDELQSLLGRAAELGPTARTLDPIHRSDNARVAVLWDGLALRNRAALDLAATVTGVVAVDIASKLGGRESTDDIAGYLDNWFDAIVVRSPRHAELVELAAKASVPVLNAGTPESHPLEVLADLAFLGREIRSGHLRVVFVGPATNVLTSWIEASARLDVEVVQVSPPAFAFDRGRAPEDARFTATDDLTAIEDADVLYTDCWWPVRLAPDAQREALAAELAPYRITTDLVARLPGNSVFLHGPPVTPELEVSADVLAAETRSIRAAKAWLLPATVAALLDLVATREVEEPSVATATGPSRG